MLITSWRSDGSCFCMRAGSIRPTLGLARTPQGPNLAWSSALTSRLGPSGFTDFAALRISAFRRSWIARCLGRVDGFDDDEAQSECDEGSEVPVRFLATERNALEALELAHKLLDAGAGAIERLREEGRPVLGRCLDRDHRADAALAGG